MFEMSKVSSLRVFELALYATLFCSGLVFVRQSFENYMEGRTDHSLTQEPISKDDLPTLSVCFTPITGFCRNDQQIMEELQTEFIYGKNFQIFASVLERENKTVLLELNRRVSTNFGLELLLSKFRPKLEIRQEKIREKLDCYMIQPFPSLSEDTEDIDFQLFRMEMKFNFHESFFRTLSNRTCPSVGQRSEFVTNMKKKITITS